MKIELITQIVTLLALTITCFFQVRNYIKYRLTNGANVKRVLLLIMTVLFICHTVRLMLGFSQGFFFSASIIVWLLLYNDWIEKIKEKLKKA